MSKYVEVLSVDKSGAEAYKKPSTPETVALKGPAS